MEIYSASNSSGVAGFSDPTATSSSGAGLWPIRRGRIASTSPNAFLGPAFDEVQRSNGPLDLDPVLLRYTRPRLRFSSSMESSSSSNSPDSCSTSLGRAQLRRILQLRSASSLSSLGSCHGYKKPVDVEIEEGVLVMDGILVSSERAAAPTSRVRFPRDLVESSGSQNSPVGGAGGTGSLYKTGICRAWEDSGLCRYGSRCQFAHGKEELRPGPTKLVKLEVGGQGSNKYYATASPDTRGVYHHSVATAPLSSKIAKFLAAAPPPARTITVETAAEVVEEAIVTNPAPAQLQLLELPCEEVSSFVWPPSEAEEKHIQEVLYGPGKRGRRLPVFEKLCAL